MVHKKKVAKVWITNNAKQKKKSVPENFFFFLNLNTFVLKDNYPDNSSAGPGVLSCIPSTLTRWTEEAKVLDGDSVHDCVTGKHNFLHIT